MGETVRGGSEGAYASGESAGFPACSFGNRVAVLMTRQPYGRSDPISSKRTALTSPDPSSDVRSFHEESGELHGLPLEARSQAR